MYRNRIVYLGDTRVSWKLDMHLWSGSDGFSQSFHRVIGPKLSNFIVLDNFYRVHVLIGSLNKIVFGYQRILVLHIKILCMNQQVFYYLKTLSLKMEKCYQFRMHIQYNGMFPFPLQDYHWWWRSFIVSGGSAVYVFAYSIFYFVTKVSFKPFFKLCLLHSPFYILKSLLFI